MKMTKSDLKLLIQECIEEMSINENAEVEVEEATDIVAEMSALTDLMEMEIPDFEDATIEEGANLDMRAKWKEKKGTIKADMKALKKAIKAKDKKEATAKYNTALKDIDDLIKDIKAIDSTAGSVVIGYFTAFTITFVRNLIICLFIPFGASVLAIQQSVNSLVQLVKDIKDPEASGADTLNMYRNTLLRNINLVRSKVVGMKKKIDALEG